MRSICISVLLLAFLTACQSSSTGNDQANTAKQWTPPAAGVIVAADSMKVADDLNDFYFAVTLTSSHENNKPGKGDGFVYDLDAHFGPNDAMSSIRMPRGGRDLQPLLRKVDNEDYGYIIGFIPGKDMGGDGVTFQPYYLVKAVKSSVKVAIEIKGLKQYSFN
jgi:hypothetical protein